MSAGGRVGPDVCVIVLNPLEASPHGYLSSLRSFPALTGTTTQAKLVFVTSAQENFSTSGDGDGIYLFYLSIYSETGSHYIALAGLRLTVQTRFDFLSS